jgi:hypothetical protein
MTIHLNNHLGYVDSRTGTHAVIAPIIQEIEGLAFSFVF